MGRRSEVRSMDGKKKVACASQPGCGGGEEHGWEEEVRRVYSHIKVQTVAACGTVPVPQGH